MCDTNDSREPLKKFAQLAEKYCSFVDTQQIGNTPTWLRELEELLAQLHIAILSVEDDMPSSENSRWEELKLSHDEWSELAGSIQRATYKKTAALHAWHLGLDEECKSDCNCEADRAGMFFDDLADIYRDLKNGLSVWKLQTKDAIAQAAWDWRIEFEQHWGEHLFRAMATVHEIRNVLYLK